MLGCVWGVGTRVRVRVRVRARTRVRVRVQNGYTRTVDKCAKEDLFIFGHSAKGALPRRFGPELSTRGPALFSLGVLCPDASCVRPGERRCSRPCAPSLFAGRICASPRSISQLFCVIYSYCQNKRRKITNKHVTLSLQPIALLNLALTVTLSCHLWPCSSYVPDLVPVCDTSRGSLPPIRVRYVRFRQRNIKTRHSVFGHAPPIQRHLAPSYGDLHRRVVVQVETQGVAYLQQTTPIIDQ